MRKFLRYSLLSVCFILIMTAVSVSLPPGFLLPKPDQGQTATILSLTPVPAKDSCVMVFDFEGEQLEILDPISSCSTYSVGEKVKV